MIAEGSPNSPANRRHASARRTATRSWSTSAGPAVSAQRLDRPGPFAYSRRMAKRDSLARYAAEPARLAGKARTKKLTAEQRREVARKAAAAWLNQPARRISLRSGSALELDTDPGPRLSAGHRTFILSRGMDTSVGGRLAGVRRGSWASRAAICDLRGSSHWMTRP